ncbi:L,D-transpeptidase family protein [Chitinophagaceae bacterium LB-8]|uniref:L,D-transpeptidase family protein n=1 Tax=Paraflavisolibacter caeni TaxID=2982496 RepID=A0A9X2XUT3_9BACT|nr:L,D-transpeptidase family protein [Paraflavisolibacter caeni]MCU7549285.1 L,D-transpeptidase family protein [Paraflavisolibacter caeni]
MAKNCIYGQMLIKSDWCLKVCVWVMIVVGFLTQMNCQGKQLKASLPVVPRDTTIKPQDAYSQLFLDSNFVASFIKSEVSSDSVANDITNFYNIRNFQYAWFHEDGLTEQADVFWNLYVDMISNVDSSIYNRSLYYKMDQLLNEDTLYPLDPEQQALLELRLTQVFFRYVQVAYKGKLHPEQMKWYIPRRKLDAVVLLDSLFVKKNNIKEWKPLNPSFHRLYDALFQYYSIEKNGGWPTIQTSSYKWKKGDKHKVIGQIKRRLRTSGDFPSADSSFLYTDSLEDAVKRIKVSYGMKDNGIIDAAFIKELNVSVGERLKQMLVNLERMRWMPEQPQNYIVANIPEYKLHVYEGGRKVISMNIVVGKAANKTVIFSDQLKYVVFNPYWNVPRSIVRKEMMPAIQRNANYLSRNNMEITGYKDGLPVVRQKPGPGNALGNVKFIFPNQYNIYFHDTPAKTLFSRQKRAFSHGCIRLQKPMLLANYLLQSYSQWTPEQLKAIMNNKTERWLTLDQPVPVFITYFTCWVTPTGVINFREDIYGHDSKMAQHLFQ